MSSPEEWFKNLTPVCKTWLSIAVITTVGASFGVLNIELIYLSFPLVFKKFQIWRLITNFFFFGKLGFKWIFQMFILYKYTTMLEQNEFQGPRGIAELLHLMIFGGIMLTLFAWIIGGMYFLGPGLTFTLLYVWSRKSPNANVSFWGFQFKAWHLPFVLLILGCMLLHLSIYLYI